MKKKVLILHGLNGSDYPHWQAQLAIDLIKQNIAVSFPSLPNRNNPSLRKWKDVVKEELRHFKPNIVVCHSLGNILWFHLCEEINIILDKLVLVAPVRINCNVKEIKEFFPYPICKDLKSKKAIMIGSTNDPYMNVKEFIQFKNKLNIKMKLLEKAGHINFDSGYGKFNYVLEWIKQKKEHGE